MGDPQSRSLVVVVMGRPINEVMCRMVIAAILDVTLRAHAFDETKWKMRTVASSQFGFEKASANNDKFSRDTIRHF
jgi:hypothetical protein